MARGGVSRSSPDAVPVSETGDVDGGGESVTHLDEIEGVGVGSTARSRLDLDAGNNDPICDLPDHDAARMHAPRTAE